MKRTITIIITLIVILLLAGCGSKEKYEPFPLLSKETVSPEREADLQAALNGFYIPPTEEPVEIFIPMEEPDYMPDFDEDSFFAEVDSISDVDSISEFEADENPFPEEPVPTDTPVPPTPTPMPTATPLPTATKPYDPNIMMYGTQNGLTTYTLQEGDDLICLGRRFDISVSQLMAQNNLSDPNEVGIGDTIYLPRNPNSWSMIDGYGRRMQVYHPATYSTQDGDTLFSIACIFGDVLPEDIAVQNQLVLGEPLPSGLAIVIP